MSVLRSLALQSGRRRLVPSQRRIGSYHTYASLMPVLAKPEMKNPDLPVRVFEQFRQALQQDHAKIDHASISGHGDARAHQADAVEVRLLAGVFLGALPGLVALVEQFDLL